MGSQIRHKEFAFPVEVAWEGGRRTSARVAGKQSVRIATPPEFRGADPELWSPEDALVAAAASCLAVTIVALVDREQLPLNGLSVEAEGIVGRRPDGRFGFVRIEQTVRLDTNPGHEEAARALVAKAEDGCLVTVSLDLPVQTRLDVRSRWRNPGSIATPTNEFSVPRFFRRPARPVLLRAADQFTLLALVPAGQILSASYAPYGRRVASATIVLRAAMAAGLSAQQIVSVAGGQLERLLAGAGPLDLGPAPMRSAAAPGPLVERVDARLVAAAARPTAGYPAEEYRQLARLACRLPVGHRDILVVRSVRELLDRHAQCIATDPPHRGPRVPGIHLIFAAAAARTPELPVP